MTMPKGWKSSTNSSYTSNKPRINISNYKNADKTNEIKKALIIGVSQYDNLPQLDSSVKMMPKKCIKFYNLKNM